MLAAACLIILGTWSARSIGRIVNKRLGWAPKEPWVIPDGSVECGAEPRAAGARVRERPRVRALLPARRLRRSLSVCSKQNAYTKRVLTHALNCFGFLRCDLDRVQSNGRVNTALAGSVTRPPSKEGLPRSPVSSRSLLLVPPPPLLLACCSARRSAEAGGTAAFVRLWLEGGLSPGWLGGIPGRTAVSGKKMGFDFLSHRPPSGLPPEQ